MSSVCIASASIRDLVSSDLLKPVFQPIAALRDASIFGYEGLIRGPEDTPLARPEQLFALARSEGSAVELEVHCCAAAMREFMRCRVSGRLLINLSETAIHLFASGMRGSLADLARSFGLAPGRLLIELTAHAPINDSAALAAALKATRALGIGLAIDDFGDGRTSLQMWCELRPDLVKVDRQFVQGIYARNRNLEFLRVFVHAAERFGGALVAEGVEDEADLAVLRDLGVPYGQGFLFGRPHELPATEMPGSVISVLASRKLAVLPEINQSLRGAPSAGSLSVVVDPVPASTTIDRLAEIFRELTQTHAIAVVNGDRPVGLINRQRFLDRYVQPYYREIFGRRPCTECMNGAPVLAERDASIETLFEMMKGEDQSYLADGFIVCDDGRYFGLGTGERLVRAMTEIRLEAARHANPLTALPGNIPISTHIGRLLVRGTRFVACYCDLSNFKPFNDVYGYWRGDEMIRLAASTLVTHSDPRHDFVGHVGGDDFIMLLQSEDWEERSRRMLGEFNARARELYDAEARAAGFIRSEDRHGNPALFALTTLVIGAIVVEPGEYSRPEQVASGAAQAKRLARQSDDGFVLFDPEDAARQGVYIAERLPHAPGVPVD